MLLEAPGAQRYGLRLASEAQLMSASVYVILARLERACWLTAIVLDALRQLAPADGARCRDISPAAAP